MDGGFFLLLLLMAGCLPDLSNREILDLERMPQEPLAYLDPATARQPLIAFERQQDMAEEFLERFFLAWHTEAPLESTNRPFDWIGEEVAYAENLRPAGAERLQELLRQVDRDSYPDRKWMVFSSGSVICAIVSKA